MFILKIYSDSHSFAAFAAITSIPIYSTWVKGDVRRRSTGETHTSNRISFDISGRDWDDFPGQVADAIAFLQRWELELIQHGSLG